LEQTGANAARRRGIGYACGVVALFSSFVLVSRFGLSTTPTLMDIAPLRFGIGGLLLWPILTRHGFSGLNLFQPTVLAILGRLGFALLAYVGFALLQLHRARFCCTERFRWPHKRAPRDHAMMV
jgi:threonine/homoserine/homoserine lactone efflux protein